MPSVSIAAAAARLMMAGVDGFKVRCWLNAHCTLWCCKGMCNLYAAHAAVSAPCPDAQSNKYAKCPGAWGHSATDEVAEGQEAASYYYCDR